MSAATEYLQIGSAIVETPAAENGQVLRVFDSARGQALELDERDWLTVTDNAGVVVSYPPQRIVCVYWTRPA